MMKPRDAKESGWIVEALLHSQDNPSLPLQQIMVHGALFPIDLSDCSLSTLKTNAHLEIFRHSLSENLIRLRSCDDQPLKKDNDHVLL
jgi:hypothetical protein